MGGIVKSTKGFLGLDSGPTVQTQTQNNPLTQAQAQSEGAARGYSGINGYATGKMSLSDALNQDLGNENWNIGRNNELATGATTGSKFATDQVNNNSILGGLYGSGPNSQLSQAEDRQNFLTNNGYSLTKEDNDALGQVSGNIARQYGTQENSLAQALASHGLSAAPSGAAAIQFTGLAGNKNEALAQAQTNIAQQRIQNNANAIAQNQSFLSSLGGQASNAIQQQYQRQLQGAQNQQGNMQSAAQITNAANGMANNANLNAAQFAQDNKPQNFMDMAQGGFANAIGAGSKTAGQNAGNKMFGASSTASSGGGGAAAAGA